MLVAENQWLLAIETPRDGFLAGVTESGPAALLSNRLDWAEGSVLLPPIDDGSVVLLETTGPTRIEYDMVSSPNGSLNRLYPW
jgi:hypothetical protein